MDTHEKELSDLRPLEPVKFPSRESRHASHTLKRTKGKPTKTVIDEMKKLSKKDIFENPRLDHVKGA